MQISFPNLDRYPGLRYGFSERADGSMHRHLCQENRARYFQQIGIDPNRVVTPDLVHGQAVEPVGEAAGGKMLPGIDGLATDQNNLFLSITTADCFPVFLYDPQRKAIGLAHAGWRGILQGIVQNEIGLMVREFRSKPENLLAGIGPGIRKCHFSFETKDKDVFEKYGKYVSSEKDGVAFIDLPGIIRKQLEDSGLRQANIQDSGKCTFCEAGNYFSHRRDKTDPIDAMVAYMGLA